ncbi:HNH endonuclease [Arthrobacter gallicola]|nr:HNH endonuclease signature motif containing protein [Arthrobacter gallicola]
MVLINADTLAGLDQTPAELNGYGPISAEAARTMILAALNWTPLLQDAASGEILAVGRRRRIPAGLKRWLQARDGTCRFPGCAVNVTRSEIDHTTPWARGGPTEHSNLEHLCPKHHRFKTLGYWKARQPAPGALGWTSPTGRTYTTQPALEFGGGAAGPGLPPTPAGPLPDPSPQQTNALWADWHSRTETSPDPPPF